MTTFSRLAAYVAVVGLLVGLSPAQDKPKADDHSKQKPESAPKKKLTVMQRKLSHAQKLIEGLSTEDFGKIREGADGLIECIKDASWRINDTDKYLAHSDSFRRSVENLQKAANDKKLDTAALAYVDITLSCVRCHRYLRDDGIVLAPGVPVPAQVSVSKQTQPGVGG